MGFYRWWKRTTLEGKIKREVGEIPGRVRLGGRTKIVVQEMERKSPADGRRFRLNVLFKKPMTYQSMPALLNEQDMRELIEILQEAFVQQ